MFAVEINRANYEYDVHSIIKAFYAEEQISIITPETKDEKRKELEGDVRMKLILDKGGAVLLTDNGRYDWIYENERNEAADHSEEGERSGVAGVSQSSPITPVYNEESGQNQVAGAETPVRRETYKDGFKRFLYRTLCGITGKTLPWGNLTGIRPTKLAYGMLEEGRTEEEILSFYEKEHYVSREKAVLGIDIAKREREILENVHYQGGFSLYIGIPFCPTTCLYCSFTSYPIAGYRKMTDTYVSCLIREMEYVSKRFAGRILDSVYIGGGTPTTLEARQLDRLICRLKELFDFTTVKEFTVEAGRADSITEEKLKVFHAHGVSRISVNPQTMKQETLDIIGRKATAEQVEEAYRLARKNGFDNINMDLILGLPGEGEADVRNTIERVSDLNPDSLTVHSLAIKRASRLNQWIQENGITMLRNTDETMRIAAEGAKNLGMKPYYLYRQKNMSGNFENVGYARPGKSGLYNILIMEEKQTIVALGAGSITKLVLPDGRIERCDNVKDVAMYIEKIDEMIARKEVLFAQECTV